MTKVENIVFIHGWGLNSAIWDRYAENLSTLRPDLSLFKLDLPGYGHCSGLDSSAELDVLAEHCLHQAPEKALWVGWSLGGLIAMRAAIMVAGSAGDRIQALQLINTTPKFTKSQDWPSGVDIALFDKFSRELASDYARTLTMFLLLQAGANKGARQLANSARHAICSLPEPSAKTLMSGIRCLENSDLRSDVVRIEVPTQIVCGAKDRVTNPSSSERLAELMGRGKREVRDIELIKLNCGHAPFLTKPTGMLEHLLALISRIEPIGESI